MEIRPDGKSLENHPGRPEIQFQVALTIIDVRDHLNWLYPQFNFTVKIYYFSVISENNHYLRMFEDVCRLSDRSAKIISPIKKTGQMKISFGETSEHYLRSGMGTFLFNLFSSNQPNYCLTIRKESRHKQTIIGDE